MTFKKKSRINGFSSKIAFTSAPITMSIKKKKCGGMHKARELFDNVHDVKMIS